MTIISFSELYESETSDMTDMERTQYEYSGWTSVESIVDLHERYNEEAGV